MQVIYAKTNFQTYICVNSFIKMCHDSKAMTKESERQIEGK